MWVLLRDMWLVTTILLPIWDCSEKLTISFVTLKGYFFNLHTHLLHNTTCMYLRNCCTCVFVWKIGEFICKCSEKDKSQIFSQITIHHILLSSSYPSGGSKEPLLAALSIARVVPKYPKMFRYVGIGQTLYNRPLPGCIVGGWYGHWPYICLHFSVESIKVRIIFEFTYRHKY